MYARVCVYVRRSNNNARNARVIRKIYVYVDTCVCVCKLVGYD